MLHLVHYYFEIKIKSIRESINFKRKHENQKAKNLPNTYIYLSPLGKTPDKNCSPKKERQVRSSLGFVIFYCEAADAAAKANR